MKKLIAASVLIFIVLAYFNSCKKAPVSPLIGTWRRIIAVDTLYIHTYDTAYIKITDDSTMQYGDAQGLGYFELGYGAYTYTANKFTFTIESNPDSTTTGICLGYPATYNYTITNSGSELTLSVVSDTCRSTRTLLRSTIFNGTWISQ